LYTRNQLGLDEHYYLGAALLQVGEIGEAGDILEKTVALAPSGSPVGQMAVQMLAFKHLLTGNWREGFRLNERRHERTRFFPESAINKIWLEFIEGALAEIPLWSEGGCSGKRLLVWAEQGLGDSIMMLRLLPALRQEWHASKVSFLCPAPLQALESCVEDVSFITANTAWRARCEEFDAYCSIMSLPHLMGITPEAIPGDMPYLRVPEAAKARWQGRVSLLPGCKVGLAWAGNRELFMDLRATTLTQLAPILSCKGVSFVSLQKDEKTREELRVSGLQVSDWMGECGDFLDTAALITNLDLVICVDTAVAHLAGALGKPVWLLNRFESDWRWLRGRADSVWYPSMRIYSQKESRNWGPVIDQVTAELAALVAKNGQGARCLDF
jgi:hypothetical protein